MKEGDSFDMDKLDQLAFRVAYLIAGFLQENLTEQEEKELDEWVGASFENQRLFEELTDPDNLDKWLKWRQQLPAAETLERLNQRLEFTDRPKKSLLRSIWPYIAAAVLIVGAVVAVKWIPGKSSPAKSQGSFAKDLTPGTNRARLTLADGTTILLDSAGNGNLASQGSTQISKLDSSQISYQSLNNNSGPATTVQINTLNIPAGGHFKVVLSDGTKVWLNAGSSLAYPTVFTQGKRAVKLEGEGYFEVAKDPMHPFEVTAAGNTVQVLGTHFNVNAYPDEPFAAVTLQEGSVRINDKTTLQAGQLAQISPDATIKVATADLEQELAWIEGQFVFKQAPLEEVMRQVARWYDCKVQFNATITEHFNASVPRDLPVSNLLDFLEGTGRVHFQVEDKKITVLP